MSHSNVAEAYIVELDKLKQHEKVDLNHLKELKEEIESDRILKMAIVVDKNTNVILDGEHRFNALRELGCRRIPVIYVDYDSPDIEVQSWRGNPHVTKKDIVEAGLGGRRFPPKTTKHMISVGDRIFHISAIEKRVNIPLEKLR